MQFYIDSKIYYNEIWCSGTFPTDKGWYVFVRISGDESYSKG